MTNSKTLFDKIWDAHVVSTVENGPGRTVYRSALHPRSDEPSGLWPDWAQRGIPVFRPKQTIATADHNVPTQNQHLPIQEKLSRVQVEKLTENCEQFGVELYGLGHPFQGIVHVIGPELGITLPGMTIVLW